jgi:hypothetical protein
MRILLSLIIILALAFLGHRWPSHLGDGWQKRVARFFGQGAGLIMFGILLGPMGLGLIDREILRVLLPLKVLTLAWIGLLFGLQFDRTLIIEGRRRAFTGILFRESLPAALMTSAFCLPWLWLLVSPQKASMLRRSPDDLWLAYALPGLLVIAALAACSSFYESHVPQIRRGMKKWPPRSFLHYACGVDQLLALLTLWILAGVVPSGNRIGGAFFGLVIPLFLGGAAGFLIALLASRKVGRQERLTIAMGGILLVSGVAMNMNLPILLVSSLVGIVIANASPGRYRLAEELHPAERPLFLVMLVLIGTSWSPGNWFISIGLALTYLVVRAGTKILSVRFLMGPLRGDDPWSGVGLLYQGAFPLAVLIDASWFLGSDIADTLSTALLLGIILSDALGASTMSLLSSRWLAAGTGQNAGTQTAREVDV